MSAKLRNRAKKDHEIDLDPNLGIDDPEVIEFLAVCRGLRESGCLDLACTCLGGGEELPLIVACRQGTYYVRRHNEEERDHAEDCPLKREKDPLEGDPPKRISFNLQDWLDMPDDSIADAWEKRRNWRYLIAFVSSVAYMRASAEAFFGVYATRSGNPTFAEFDYWLRLEMSEANFEGMSLFEWLRKMKYQLLWGVTGQPIPYRAGWKPGQILPLSLEIYDTNRDAFTHYAAGAEADTFCAAGKSTVMLRGKQPPPYLFVALMTQDGFVMRLFVQPIAFAGNEFCYTDSGVERRAFHWFRQDGYRFMKPASHASRFSLLPDALNPHATAWPAKHPRYLCDFLIEMRERFRICETGRLNLLSYRLHREKLQGYWATYQQHGFDFGEFDSIQIPEFIQPQFPRRFGLW